MLHKTKQFLQLKWTQYLSSSVINWQTARYTQSNFVLVNWMLRVKKTNYNFVYKCEGIVLDNYKSTQEECSSQKHKILGS